MACRLLARPAGLKGKAQRPLTDEEIATTGGLTLARVRLLSELLSWEDIPVQDLIAFTKGCNVDFDDPSAIDRHWRYLFRKPKWEYLKRDAAWLTRWKPMLSIMRAEEVRRLSQ